MEIDQGINTLFIASFCVVKMQISWYKLDRSCGKKGPILAKGPNYVTHLERGYLYLYTVCIHIYIYIYHRYIDRYIDR